MNQNKMGLLTSLIGMGAGFEDINLPEGMGYNEKRTINITGRQNRNKKNRMSKKSRKQNRSKRK